MISRRGRERLLVGTWQSEPGDDSWIITRRADHTFTEERTVAYPQPRTHFSSTGTWRVSGDGYYTRYTTVTHPFFASKLVGREIRAHIWQLADGYFIFQHEDAAIATERRVATLPRAQ